MEGAKRTGAEPEVRYPGVMGTLKMDPAPQASPVVDVLIDDPPSVSAAVSLQGVNIRLKKGNLEK